MVTGFKADHSKALKTSRTFPDVFKRHQVDRIDFMGGLGLQATYNRRDNLPFASEGVRSANTFFAGRFTYLWVRRTLKWYCIRLMMEEKKSKEQSLFVGKRYYDYCKSTGSTTTTTTTSSNYYLSERCFCMHSPRVVRQIPPWRSPRLVQNHFILIHSFSFSHSIDSQVDALQARSRAAWPYPTPSHHVITVHPSYHLMPFSFHQPSATGVGLG